MCGRFGSIREDTNRVMDQVEVETPLLLMRATCSDPSGAEGQAEPNGMIQEKGWNEDLKTITEVHTLLKIQYIRS